MQRTTTSHEDNEFSSRFAPVLNLEEVSEYIAAAFNPDEVFPEDELEQWATENGFVKKEETE